MAGRYLAVGSHTHYLEPCELYQDVRQSWRVVRLA